MIRQCATFCGFLLLVSCGAPEEAPPVGEEHAAVSSENTQFLDGSEALGRSTVCISDPDVRRLIAAWSQLPDSMRRQIMKLVVDQAEE